MSQSSPKDVMRWLNSNPSLSELMERYPGEWEVAGAKLVSALEQGKTEGLSEYAKQARSQADLWNQRIRKSRRNRSVLEAALPQIIRSRMFLLALEKCCLASAAGKASGKIRLSLLNGYIIQKLLFRQHLTRKPASLLWFRFWWRFISQKRILMPLVQSQGIYCFYSTTLLEGLRVIIGNRSCLEIGAGDGTLASFLAKAGLHVRATDNYSWSHAIQYPPSVEKLDAKQALEKYKPQAVLCSWPPPGNHFERHVFTARSVELYVVIGSRYGFASGNWADYANQGSFAWHMDSQLSNSLIPPELDSAVLIFRRKAKP